MRVINYVDGRPDIDTVCFCIALRCVALHCIVLSVRLSVDLFCVFLFAFGIPSLILI